MVDEVLDKTITGLKDLNKATIDAGIEFQGFTKNLIVAADATSNAGQKWTVFSRLVSGSPIWAIQNKFRAYLAILGGFEKRSKENSARQQEINDKFVEQRKAVKTITEEYESLLDATEKLNIENVNLTEAFESDIFTDHQKEMLGIIENTHEYQRVLAATNDERLAAEKAMLRMDSQMKKYNEKNAKMEKAAKEAYAFDRKRIEDAIKLAEIEAEAQGLGKAGIKKAGVKAGDAEKKAMKREQKKLAVPDDSLLIESVTSIGEQFRKNFEPIKKWIPFTKKKQSILEKVQEKSYKIQVKGRKFAESVKPLLNMAFKYLVFGIMAAIGFMAVAAFLYNAWGELQSLGIMDTIMEFGNGIKEVLGLVFETFQAFTTGGVEEGFAKLKELGLAILNLIFIGLNILFKVGVSILYGVWASLFDFLDYLIFKEGWKVVVTLLSKLALFLVAAFFVKYLIGVALTLAGIYALPVLIGVFLLAGLYSIVKWAVDKINPFSEGGVSSGGLSIVGEKGPELVKLPAGSRVHSNKESKKLVSSGGGGNTINITINARDTSDAELRRIADKIGNMVNNKINRRTSSGSMG